MFNFKTIATKAGKAVHNFNMINESDNILVCFSGGKDSFALLRTLQYLQKKYPISFNLKVLVINPSFDNNYEKKLKKVLDEEDIDYEILNTQISDVIKEQNSKKKNLNPCFMCSRLRRGIIYNYAIDNKFNKIALGHTLDDAIETHLMNLFFGNKTSFLKPKYLAENGKIEVIRPLIYVDENKILDFIKYIKFKPIKNKCPMKKKNSKREYFKKQILKLEKFNPKIKESCYHAFRNVKELNEWK